MHDARIAAISYEPNGVAPASRNDIDVLVEATGNPRAGIMHAEVAIVAGKHVITVNVEADALIGLLLTKKADAAGVCYSMAYGDQPALASEMVNWASAAGFDITAAGKSTKYLPIYHDITPDEVWIQYGLTKGETHKAGMSPQLFYSFLDGT